jgi:hypothetical protein
MATPSPELVTARLRELAVLSRDAAPAPVVDYSPQAVTERLRELADLSELCARLVEIGRAARRR